MSPDLGSDSITMGVSTGLLGAALVLAFMVGIYGRWGLIACLGLAVNVGLVFGLLSLLGATLTLPGIAGIILTIGMAVDANILINERIKEEAARGTCRVICFSPDHSRTLPEMSRPEVRAVIDTWATQIEELGERFPWVQVFENKGAAMGCSNPHPHGQIWATSFEPTELAKETREQRAYLAEHGRPLLLDYVELESESGERVVVETAVS